MDFYLQLDKLLPVLIDICIKVSPVSVVFVIEIIKPALSGLVDIYFFKHLL